MSTAEWRREGAQGRKKGRKKAIRVISGNEDNGVGDGGDYILIPFTPEMSSKS